MHLLSSILNSSKAAFSAILIITAVFQSQYVLAEQPLDATSQLSNQYQGAIYTIIGPVPAEYKALAESIRQELVVAKITSREINKDIKKTKKDIKKAQTGKQSQRKRKLNKLLKEKKQKLKERLSLAQQEVSTQSGLQASIDQTQSKLDEIQNTLLTQGINTDESNKILDFGILGVDTDPSRLSQINGAILSPNHIIRGNSASFKTKRLIKPSKSTQVSETSSSGSSNPASSDISICILDSGIEGAHPAFDCGSIPCANNKIIAAKSFIAGENPLVDLNGHGSHVAAIAAGNQFSLHPDPGVFPAGTEPRAKLIASQVLDYTGSGSLLSLAKGIAFCLDPFSKGHYRNRASIINMSLGFPFSFKSYHPGIEPLNRAIGLAAQAGTFIAKAAGNDRANKQLITGSEFDSMDVTAVAPFPEMLTVGATNPAGNLAEYSSVGPQTWQDNPQSVQVITGPDLIAPGTFCSARSAYGTITTPCPQYGNSSLLGIASGTSMAAPVAAGTAAKVLLSNRSLSGKELKEILRQSVTKLSSTDPVRVGSGKLNISQSVNNAQKIFPTIDDSIPLEVRVNPQNINSISNVRLRANLQSRSGMRVIEVSVFRGGRTWSVVKRRDVSGLKVAVDETISFSSIKGSAPVQESYILKLKAQDRNLASEAFFVVTTKDYMPPLIPLQFYARPILYNGVLCGNITIGFDDPYLENFKDQIRGETYLVKVASLVGPAEQWSFQGSPGPGSVAIDIDARSEDLTYQRLFSFINFYTDTQGNTNRVNLHTGMTYRDWCRNGPPTPTPTPAACTAPVITQQPVGGEFDFAERMELEVKVDAATLAQGPEFRWFKNGNELPDRTSILVRSFTARDEGNYTVVVRLRCGEVVSQEAIVRRKPI